MVKAPCLKVDNTCTMTYSIRKWIEMNEWMWAPSFLSKANYVMGTSLGEEENALVLYSNSGDLFLNRASLLSANVSHNVM